MATRLRRPGQLQANTAGVSFVEFTTPCGHCSAAGCAGRSLSAGGASQSLLLSAALSSRISGRIDEIADLSISRSGLTQVCLLLFGPTLLALAVLAFISHRAGDGGGFGLDFGLLGLSALGAALLLGATLVRRFGIVLMDLNLEMRTDKSV